MKSAVKYRFSSYIFNNLSDVKIGLVSSLYLEKVIILVKNNSSTPYSTRSASLRMFTYNRFNDYFFDYPESTVHKPKHIVKLIFYAKTFGRETESAKPLLNLLDILTVDNIYRLEVLK